MTRSNSPTRRAIRTLSIAVSLGAAASLVLPAAPGFPAKDAKCAGKRATIVATPGDDVIRAPARGPEVIVGLGGDDAIHAGRGRDIICGGAGNDTIQGGGGKDRIYAGPGDNTIYGGRGVDRTYGGDGDDHNSGGPGRDLILGGTGDDDIFGGDGRDRIHGEDENDYVDGGPGSDRVWGDGGDDLNLGRDGADWLDGGSGNDRLYGGLVDDRLWGGPGNDALVDDHGMDLIYGGPGSDLLRGGLNHNAYDGGPGHDTASFATATPGGRAGSTLGVKADLNSGTAATDDVDGLRGIERVLGSSFDDELIGAPGTSVDGGLGDDDCAGFSIAVNCGGSLPRQYLHLDLRDPRDPGLVLIGGNGPDRWKVHGSPHGVTVEHQTPMGFDDSRCSRLTDSTISCTVVPRFVLVWGGNGAESIEVGGSLRPETTVDVDGGSGGNLLIGGSNDDVLIDRGGRNRMYGRQGSDALISDAGRDFLDGGEGNDQLVSSTPCDRHVFIGGPGKIDISGFARASYPIRASRGGVARRRGGKRCSPSKIHISSEVLEGSRFGDMLIGTRRADYLIGGEGNDLVIGRGGRDLLSGDPGRDRCIGGSRTISWRSCEVRVKPLG